MFSRVFEPRAADERAFYHQSISAGVAKMLIIAVYLLASSVASVLRCVCVS